MWNLKTIIYKEIKQNKNILTDIENKLVVTSGERQDRGRELRGRSYYVQNK